ncbi:MAG: hypothetical protein WC557_10070 [Ignavibacteriaceae bacterium]
MKKITAYVNTTRVHWLVEELQTLGVQEIKVTEYFKPLSQISRFELSCDDHLVENVRAIVHKIGTCGQAADHAFFVYALENKYGELKKDVSKI